MKKNTLLISIIILSGCATSQNVKREVAGQEEPFSCMSFISSFLSNPFGDATSKFEPKFGEQTLETSSGLQIYGDFTTLSKLDDNGEIIYFETKSPTSLYYRNGKEIMGQGMRSHPKGFSSPLGLLKDSDTPIENLSLDELKKLGIEVGKDVRLEYRSGVVVTGKLEKIESYNGNMSFSRSSIRRQK